MTKNANHHNRLDVIDIFRFFAALLVVGVHAIVTGYTPPTITTLFDAPMYYVGPFNYFAPFIRGHMGVQLFFIISGYCMALVGYKDKYAPELDFSLRKLSTYYKYFIAKRIYRIYPLFLIHILILAFVFDKPREYLLETLLFLQNISPNSITAISSVTWSLAVEVQFYLIFPVLFLFVRNKPYRLLAIYLCALIYQFTSPQIFSFVNNPNFSFIAGSSVMGYLHYFIFGLLLYEFRKFITEILFRYGLWVLLLLVFLVSSFYDTGRNLSGPLVENFRVVFVYSAAFLMCIFVEKDKSSGWIKTVLAYLGRASYSIYLMHIFAGPIIHSSGIAASNRYVLAIQTVLLGLLVGVISFELIEKFFDKRKNLFLSLILKKEKDS